MTQPKTAVGIQTSTAIPRWACWPVGALRRKDAKKLGSSPESVALLDRFSVLVTTGLRLSTAADPVSDTNRVPLRGRSGVENWAAVESRISC